MIPFHILLALAVVSPEARVAQLRSEGASDIRVHRVQLDADAPLEVVLQFIAPAPAGAHCAEVWDEGGGGWHTVGKFDSWFEFQPKDADRFLEFRETVEAGVRDMIVRRKGGGTEVSGTTLRIHRLRNGTMAEVLSISEEETAMEHPSGDVYVTKARVTFALGRVTVESVRQPGDKRTRATYVWDAARFRFSAE